MPHTILRSLRQRRTALDKNFSLHAFLVFSPSRATASMCCAPSPDDGPKTREDVSGLRQKAATTADAASQI